MKKRKNISIQSTASVIYSNSTLEGFEHCDVGTSLMVQWLRFCAFTAGGTGSIPR